MHNGNLVQIGLAVSLLLLAGIALAEDVREIKGVDDIGQEIQCQFTEKAANRSLYRCKMSEDTGAIPAVGNLTQKSFWCPVNKGVPDLVACQAQHSDFSHFFLHAKIGGSDLLSCRLDVLHVDQFECRQEFNPELGFFGNKEPLRENLLRCDVGDGKTLLVERMIKDFEAWKRGDVALLLFDRKNRLVLFSEIAEEKKSGADFSYAAVADKKGPKQLVLVGKTSQLDGKVPFAAILKIDNNKAAWTTCAPKSLR